MAADKRRDNAYWVGRLEREHPELAKQVARGELTVRQARLQAGLMRQPSGYEKLERAWKTASPDDRRKFIAKRRFARVSRASITPKDLVDDDARLRLDVVVAVRRHMEKKRLKSGDVCEALGLSRLHAGLGVALGRNERVKPTPDLLDRLARWVAEERILP